tara:strand:- start:3801 stop:4607 length:807 start_codon:yes stop_codon:yes gene_type:complete
MKKKIKIKASVIVINYNNSKYIKRCVESLNSQTYKNFEIIFVDDQSKDNSIKIIKKLKKKNSFKLFITKSRTNFGGYNQINACKLGLKKSNGKIIFFLDSDDFFVKKKIETFIKYFDKKKKIPFLMDKPYIYYDKKNKYPMKISKRNQSFIPWPQISSQSCIAVKKKYLDKIIRKIEVKKFPSIWFDFRLTLQVFLDFKKLTILDKNLTFYQKSSSSVSSAYKKFSLNWWKRRKEAHNFYLYLCKKNKLNSKISIDYIFTNLFNFFIK